MKTCLVGITGMSAWLTRPSNFSNGKLHQCKTGNLHSICSKAYAGQKTKGAFSNVHKKRDLLGPSSDEPIISICKFLIFGWSCVDPGVGFNDSYGSIPTQHILWFLFFVFGKETSGLLLTHITCVPLGTPWTKSSEEGKSWYLTFSSRQPNQEWRVRKIGGAFWASLDKIPFRLKGFRCLPSKRIADLKEAICSKWISPLLIL